MTRKTVSNILTCMVIVALLGIFIYKQRGAAPQKENAHENAPESAIWRMLDASRAQDVERYLGCYTGETEALLRKNVQEMGAAAFREYLSNSLREVKGVAVLAAEKSSADECHVSVQFVYDDRNEVQQMYLRRVGKEWKILRLEGTERVKTLVPYGTPVTE